jgi:2'-5' RNA ligase
MAIFAAIELDERARETALRAMEAVAAAMPEMRLERPEKLHVTLAYVGRIDRPRVPSFTTALGQAARDCAEFEIVFDTLGGFGKKRRAHVIAYTCSTQNQSFERCAGSVRAAFSELGAEFEHPALPHLTIARAKHGVREVSRIEAPQPCVVAAREIVLLESVPAGQTTRYEKRAVAPLRVAGAY